MRRLSSLSFESTDAILDSIQYGAPRQGWASIAVEAGIWNEGEFATAAAQGQTLAFVGGGDGRRRPY